MQTGRVVVLRNPISWLPKGNRHKPHLEVGAGQTRILPFFSSCVPAVMGSGVIWAYGRQDIHPTPQPQPSTEELRALRKMHLD